MMTVKVPLKKAEDVKLFLMGNGFMDSMHCIAKDEHFIYFPIKKKDDSIRKNFPALSFTNKNLKNINKSTPRDSLKKILSKKELDLIGSSFDIVGNILILELPRQLVKKEKEIAKAFLKLKNIKTVVKKLGGHEGEFRLQKYRFLAGIDNKETIHKESGVLIKLDIEKTYFSPRSASERLRIARLVKRGEDVLVMFSGCAPYVVVIAKNSMPKSVYGIELNKEAHDYAIQNVSLNKIKNAFLFNGDVKDVMPEINKKFDMSEIANRKLCALAQNKMAISEHAQKTRPSRKCRVFFDRIIMPLPKTSQDFLDLALNFIKKNGMIHFYDFSQEKDFPESSIKKIESICKKMKKKFRVVNSVKCGQSAPNEFRICIDFVIL